MYYHFHSIQLNDVPMFLALDISRLPPRTSNSNNMTTILQNNESMQTHIKTLTEAQKTMSLVMAAYRLYAKSTQALQHMLIGEKLMNRNQVKR